MKRIYLVVLLFTGFGWSQDQAKIDSIQLLLPKQSDTVKMNSYNSIFNMLVRKQPEVAKKYLDTLLTAAHDSKNSSFIAKALRSEGVYFYYQSDYYASEKSYTKSIQLYEELNQKKPLSAVLNNLGIVQKYLGKLEAAAQTHLRSLKLKEELGLGASDIAASLVNIGVLQWELGNLELSTEYYEKAEKLCQENGLTWGLNLVRGNLAANYKNSEQYDKALKYYNMVLAHWEEQKDYPALAKNLNSVGALYFQMDSISKAKSYYIKSLELSRKYGEPQMVGLTTRNLGKVSMKEGRHELALQYFLKAQDISKKTGTMVRNVGDHLNIAEAYAALGNYKEAYRNRAVHFEKYDSIFEKEKIEQINDLEARYQSEKKEAAIALQEEEIKTLNEKAKVDQLTKGLYAGGMASALALSGLLVFGFRQRIKKNRIAREKQEEIYRNEIEHKKKELTSQTLHLVQKNTFIQELMENLQNIKNDPDRFKVEFRRIVMLLKKENASDKDWETFKTYFAEVHNDFDQKLKTLSSDISEKEIRLAAFLRMNLTTKEIAATMNVMPDSILKSKYRLKKKLGLSKDTDLTTFLNTL
ncbi:tetratricopeptide repeat protein [Poritiphilus flavus]|uniref:Tetratricopeptide repeat protein n=1 Tax=Poritiphilus flavus TaxID=2697053 RepID=A0A6L9EEI6_9FLAO|nr:tetratricopeptide repeat protein [Poritiphilus flavus]NAS13155.1 tetratricopeptide repeat protein [Poritiphilus flavus]